MDYKRFDNIIAVRLDKDDEISEQIKLIAEKENITAGSVSGIGATDDFTIGVFDLEKSDYEQFSFTGNHEITSLSGNISTMNGEKYVHLHITCAGKEGKIVGGHLLKGVISLTGEIFISVADGLIDRKRDETLGINRFILS